MVPDPGDRRTRRAARRRSGTSSPCCPPCCRRRSASGPFVIGWLSRGSGAPLELITNAGPLTPPRPPRRASERSGPAPPARSRCCSPAARAGVRDRRRVAGRSGRPGVDAVPGPSGAAARRPSRAATRRDQAADAVRVDAGHADVPAVRAGWWWPSRPTCSTPRSPTCAPSSTCCGSTATPPSARRFDAERAERRMQELDAFREAGLWNVRVLAGAASRARSCGRSRRCSSARSR